MKERPGDYWFALLLLGALCTAAPAAESQWVRTGVTGRLIYVPDAEGDRILDFSDVGYQGRGTELLPMSVPNVITLAPIAGDDTTQIQNAINAVAAMPLGPDGFRGAVLLGAGHYDINTQLTIGASGVVLRGVGRNSTDTVLHGRGTTQRPLVQVLGSGSPSFSGNPKRNMIDKVVPVGATSFRVDQTSGLAVGDTVRVERPSTAEWIAAVGMDNPPDDDPPWEPGAMNIRFDRTITRIEGNRVFLDAPLANSFELQYGGGTIQKYTWNGRIENVGIENLRAESDFTSATDEAHAWEFIAIGNAQHVWVRQTASQYFGDSAVVSNPTAKWVTVDDAQNFDPVSVVTGERRYTFDLSGQLELVTNSQANSGRHDFVNNSTRPAGPHVFHNSIAHNALNDSGPHQRWATGTLFDNVTVNGDNINTRNRGSFGTTHGWSGANMVIWNSQADGFIVQNPPTAQNWLIGSTGTIQNDTQFGPQPPGTVDSHGTPVTVGGTHSLYEAQMNDSADIREFHWTANSGTWNDALGWQEAVTPGVYRVSTRDYLVGDIDGFTFDGAASVDRPFLDASWRAAIADSSALPITGLDDLAGNQNVAFTIQHQLDAGERVVHGFLALGLRQSAGSEVATDFLRLFDTAPEHRLDFATLGWNSQVNSTGTFVGVVDMGGYLEQMQSSAVNVQLNDDTGLDWAMYVATVATPIASATGPDVFVDGGSVAIDVPTAPVESLHVGADAMLHFALGSSFEFQPAIAVAGQAALDGTLAVTLAPGYVPMADDSFELISAGGLAGAFDEVLLPALGPELTWDLAATDNSLVLSVVEAIAGDFNRDGVVDTADFTVWRDGLGTLYTAEHFDQWRSNFGYPQGGGGAASRAIGPTVPEPCSLALLAPGSLAIFVRLSRSCRLR